MGFLLEISQRDCIIQVLDLLGFDINIKDQTYVMEIVKMIRFWLFFLFCCSVKDTFSLLIDCNSTDPHLTCIENSIPEGVIELAIARENTEIICW